MVLNNEGEHGSRWSAILFDFLEDRLCAANAQRVGEEGRGRHGRPCWHHYRHGREDEGFGAREPRASSGQRDSAQGVCIFCPGGARPPVQTMIAFIDDDRVDHGVEPICRVLPIAPSTYHRHVAKQTDPSRLSCERQGIWRYDRDQACIQGKLRGLRRPQALATDATGRLRYSPLNRRKTDERLGITRRYPRKPVRTTISNKAAPCRSITSTVSSMHPDQMSGCQTSPTSPLGRASFMSRSSSMRMPSQCRVACSRTAHTGFVLDALEQALHDQRPVQGDGLIHHSDRGSQYVSIKYIERLALAGIEPSVGSVGDSGAGARA